MALLLASGVLALVIAVVLILWPPRPLVNLVARLNPDVLYRVRTSHRAVALTIDDSPHPDVTPLILETLREHGARATFFVIGERVPGNEAILHRLVQEGHELGNHDLTDRLTLAVPKDRLPQDLGEVDHRLRAFGPVRWFRPGMGWFSKRLVVEAGRLGYRVSLGSTYPHDAHLHHVALVTRLVASRIYPGAIVILHDGLPDRVRTVAVLARLLPALRQRGYEVVTLSELAALETRRVTS